MTVSSPVMARAGLRGLSMARDNRDVAIVIPAEGPVVVEKKFPCQLSIHQMGFLNPAHFQVQGERRKEGKKRPTIFLNGALGAVEM